MTCSNCGKKVFAKETCQCGVKAPNSHGFGVGLSSVIFFIIVMISVICLIATLSLRTVVKKELIQKKIENVSLSEISVDNQKLDEYIYENFIDDDRITVENVDNVLAAPFIKDFINDKLNAYADFCLDKGELPEVTADEIIKLIEDNEDFIYKEAGLRFLEADKEELRNNLSMLDSYNEFRIDKGEKWLVTAPIHTFFSFWNVIFLYALLAVVFINWLLIYKFNSRRASKMIRKYSKAVIIPSGIILAGAVTVPFILKYFASSSTSVFYDILKGFSWNDDIKAPFIMYSGAALLVGLILEVFSIIFSGKSKSISSIDETDGCTVYNQAEIPEMDTVPDDTVMPEPAYTDNAISEEPVNEQTAEQIPGKCIQCGHQNRETASFCAKCGTNLK